MKKYGWKGLAVLLAAICATAIAAVATGAASGAVSYIITSSSQIKDGVIGTKDLSSAAREALKGDRGARGATGATGVGTNGKDGLNGKDSTVPGPQGGTGPAGTDCSGQAPASPARTCPGATGATGAQGDSYFAHAYYATAYYDVGDTNGGAIATVACSSESDTAVAGGTSTDDYTKTVPVGQSFPGRMDWTTNTPKPNRLDGWIVQFASQNGSSPLKVKVWALCVPGLTLPVTQTYQESVDG